MAGTSTTTFVRIINGTEINTLGTITTVFNIGQSGASAYQSYLATTTDDHKLTQAQWVASLKGEQGEQGIQGIQGEQGIQGVKGDTGVRGEQGVQGIQGIQGVQGEKGDKGDTGQGFKIAKTYSTLSALLADTNPTGILSGEFAIVTTVDVTDPDNGKLYIWNGIVYSYVTDMSVQGIKGDKGEQGIQGEQGLQGVQGIQGVAGKSAYEAAVEGGYIGTELQFNTDLAKVSDWYSKGDIDTLLDNKLNKPTTNQTTLADNDAVLLRKAGGTVIEILKTDLYAFLDDYFAAKDVNPSFVNGLKTTAVTDLYGNNPFLKQSDATLYNPTAFGSFTTISTIGNRLIKTGGAAFPFVGLKVTINGVDYIMSSRISNNEIEIIGTFPQNFAGISFTVNCIGFRYFAGLFYMYDYQGRIIASSTVGGGFSPSIIEMAKCYLSGATQDLTNDFILRWSSTNSVFGTKDLGISRNAAGVVEVNNGTPGTLRDLKLRSLFADKIILNALNTAPSSATDTGTLGEVRITADYIYVCVATNTWKRTLIETW